MIQVEERYIEMAEKIVESERDFGLTQVRSQLKAEYHIDFDNINCLECNNPMPQARLDYGKIRCTVCQTNREYNIKRGIAVEPNQFPPPDRPKYLDTVAIETREHENTSAKLELKRVVEKLARNVNQKAILAANLRKEQDNQKSIGIIHTETQTGPHGSQPRDFVMPALIAKPSKPKKSTQAPEGITAQPEKPLSTAKKRTRTSDNE